MSDSSFGWPPVSSTSPCCSLLNTGLFPLRHIPCTAETSSSVTLVAAVQAQAPIQGPCVVAGGAVSVSRRHDYSCQRLVFRDLIAVLMLRPTAHTSTSYCSTVCGLSIPDSIRIGTTMSQSSLNSLVNSSPSDQANFSNSHHTLLRNCLEFSNTTPWRQYIASEETGRSAKPQYRSDSPIHNIRTRWILSPANSR